MWTSRRGTGTLARFVCLALVAAGAAVPASAAAAPRRPAPPAKLRPVPGRAATARPAPKDTTRAATAAPAIRWPGAGISDVDVSATGWSWAGGRTVGLRSRQSTAERTAQRLQVRALDRAAALRAGQQALFEIGLASGATGTRDFAVAVDFAPFREAYGGDWGGRLRLAAVPACALTTPAAPACRPVPLRSTVDRAAGLVYADVSVAPPGAAPASRSAPSTLSAGTLLALAAGDSSDGGDFKATDLKPSATWSAGGSAGDFSWRYPLRMPPGLSGPVPQVGLSYSAQSVDGQTAAANSQPSWVGEGFAWQPGSIERAYRSCKDDGQAGSGDLCWAGDNATISLNGHSTALVYDSASQLWRPRDEDGSRIERLTDPALANGARDGEYWKVTTTDGVQYFFGLDRLPGAPAGTTTNSVFYEPIFGNDANEPCHGATFAASSCQQAYRWNLDYVVDPHHNTMSLFYTRETNQYARNGSAGDTPTYIRNGYLREIDYGTRQDGGADSVFTGTAPARVLFETVDRCITPGATCTTAPANQSNWPDVPLDLLCTGAGCAGRTSPTFFTNRMLAAVTTQVASGAGTWQRVERWTLDHEFKNPGDGNQKILWLSGIGHCGTDDSTCLPKVSFTAVQLSNRVDPAGTTNWIWNELSGLTIVSRSLILIVVPGSARPRTK